MPWDHWFFNPNVEFAFGDRAKEATINFDFHYDLPTHTSLYFWVGGGPAIQFFNPDNPRLDTETDFAVNIFMGVGFNKGGSVIPYLQPKVILSSRSAFSIAFGIRF
ncbi:MAG: hypothetical protein C5B54_06780 [Acidobacteria bacterium]|nr:MAG: hypothetical protein C5B54_06780 [Acidobacteriota bacterium]